MIAGKDEFFKPKPQKNENNVTIQYATVIALTLQGEPIIQFMGELLPSAKIYRCLKSYQPKAGDRVMLLNSIIIGGWKV